MQPFLSRITCRTFLTILLLASGCVTKEGVPDAFDWRHATYTEARSKIEDPRTKDDLLTILLGNIGPIDESPTFWNKIANDTKNSPLHRRRAVLQMFFRYTHSGMTLRDLAALTKGSLWLNESNIASAHDMFGGLQAPTQTQNVFDINVLPTLDATGGFGITFKIEGVTKPAVIRALLIGTNQLTPSEANAKITDFYYRDGYHGGRVDSP